MQNFKPTYHYGIWFVATADKDWMARLELKEGKWVLTYRFRYYSPDSKDPWDKKDTKNWYAFETKDDSEAEKLRMVENINFVYEATQKQFAPVTEKDFVLLECANDDPKFLAALEKRSWCHAKKL